MSDIQDQSAERKARVTKAQLDALRWLERNGGLQVAHMNMIGRAREWPQTRTLRALQAKRLIDYDPAPDGDKYWWRVDVNDAGRALLA